MLSINQFEKSSFYVVPYIAISFAEKNLVDFTIVSCSPPNTLKYIERYLQMHRCCSVQYVLPCYYEVKCANILLLFRGALYHVVIHQLELSN